MSKILLEYLPGTKGDFLSHLLNDNNLKINLPFNRSSSIKQNLKKLSHAELAYSAKPTIEEFENLVQSLPDKVINSHQLFFISNDKSYSKILEKNNIHHYKICFDNCEFQTIFIEALIKNAFFNDNISIRDIKIKEENKNYQKLPDAFSYRIDFRLFAANIEITQENRCELFHQLLVDSGTKTDKMYYTLFNSNKHNDRKKILKYKDLYIDFNLDCEIFNSINKQEYPSQVLKTWLPEQVELFGQTWKPKDYGYMQF